ncbi:MAG: hypothetical protein ACTSYS_11550 [Promethearchaeota archaeon]
MNPTAGVRFRDLIKILVENPPRGIIFNFFNCKMLPETDLTRFNQSLKIIGKKRG